MITLSQMGHWLALGLFAFAPQDNSGDDQPLPPLDAASSMQVPDGFEVTLFAGEPAIRQPISFCMDDHGRLWVAEAYNYPNHTREPGDRIVVLEDTDNDGRFDERTVFFDQLNYVTGIEVGFGGVWVMSPPYFYFIPDRDGDIRPDSEPEVLLDGFGTHANAHNLANGFAWGPDGWLYGTHGRTNWSMIGRPGDAEEDRVRFDGGVYRYHPIRHEWEPYADGTTNPWGIDWNDVGEAFICNCVNPHLFHVIQGAHYEPWRNRDSSKYAFQRVSTIADHLHFVGGGDIRSGIGTDEEDLAGGGHAHCGMMVYLGDNWPDEYRNSIFINNIHGRRVNRDIPKRSGSGYVATHGPDLLRARDPWFMGVTLIYGLDGSVFVSDWSDTGECHSVRNTRKHTGRIYRISYGEPESFELNFADVDDAVLVELQHHRNDRVVRHARRNLQERLASGADMARAGERLIGQFHSTSNIPQRLRSLWALHVIEELDTEFLVSLLEDESEYIRGWAVKLLCEDGSPEEAVLSNLNRLALDGDSPYVRLQLACALQRLDLSDRWELASALASRGEDADDANLPLMIWYGIEPLITVDQDRFVDMAFASSIPLIQQHVARRFATGPDFDAGIIGLIDGLGDADDDVAIRIFEGLLQGLEGRRRLNMPSNWSALFEHYVQGQNARVLEKAIQLAIRFNDPAAILSLRDLAKDESSPSRLRNDAISILVDAGIPQLDADLIELIHDPETRARATWGLASYEHPDTVHELLEIYSFSDSDTQQAILQTLASRPEWARGLLTAVADELISRDDLTAYTARQLESLNDSQINEQLAVVWGKVRPTDEEKTADIERYKRMLVRTDFETVDLENGQALFKQHCATCHRFFGEGAEIGPDITGAQRNDYDYLLENIVDPSATVSRDYQMEIFELESGRVLNGLVVTESDEFVRIQTVNEALTVAANEIVERTITPQSIMPDGLLEPLNDDAIRDLFAFLRSASPPVDASPPSDED